MTPRWLTSCVVGVVATTAALSVAWWATCSFYVGPQLLQVSGIGNEDDLRKVGITPVHHLPGVGENLQDHLEVYVQHLCTQPISLNPTMKFWKRPFIGFAWLFRKGPGASNHFEAGGFIRSNDQVKYPNLMFHFLPIAVRYDGTAPAGGHGYQVHIGPMYSNSRGSLKVTSGDVRDHPAYKDPHP